MPDHDAPASPDDQLVADIAGFELDPLGYILYAFPWGEPGTELADMKGPRKWQRNLADKIGKRLRAMSGRGASGKQLAKAAWQPIQEAIVSGHGIGKSAFFGMLTMWALSTHEDTKIIITANTEKQLQTKTSPELSKWHRLSINSHWFVYTATSLYSSDPAHSRTWRADLIPWSEHNTEAFAGLHNQGKRIVLFMDEGSAIADKVWEVAEGALTDDDTQIMWLAFGNGTRPTGRFRECFRKFKHRWGGEHIDSRTVEGVNLTQVQKWVDDYGEDSDFVKVRVRGMFPKASAKQFISEADVDAAFGRALHPKHYDFAPKILTVDPAWTGDDEFVIGLRQGLFYRQLKHFAYNDNDVQMAGIIASLEDDEQADAVFIDAGYGTGIVSMGRTWGRNWTLVHFGEPKPRTDWPVNKRAEMWNAARTWLKEGGCIPEDPQLHDELIAVETVARDDGRLLLESKEDMKSRGVPSPNRADALVLSFAYPVQKKAAHSVAGGGRNKVHSDWNPLGDD